MVFVLTSSSDITWRRLRLFPEDYAKGDSLIEGSTFEHCQNFPQMINDCIMQQSTASAELY